MCNWLRIVSATVFLSMTLLHAGVGSVSMLNGSATVERDGSSKSLKIGSTFEERDTIKTGKDSKIQLTFDDNTVITLGSATVLKVHEFLASSENPKMKLSITQGSFRAITGKIGKIAPQNFRLETKTASIGIRGTVIDGKIGAEYDTIRCLSGAIVVGALKFPANEPILVRAGEYTLVSPQNIPLPPMPIPTNEVSEFYGAKQDSAEAEHKERVVANSATSAEVKQEIGKQAGIVSEIQDQKSKLDANSDFEAQGEAIDYPDITLPGAHSAGLIYSQSIKLSNVKQKGRYIYVGYKDDNNDPLGTLELPAYSFPAYRDLLDGKSPAYYLLDIPNQGIFAYGGMGFQWADSSGALRDGLGVHQLSSISARDGSMFAHLNFKTRKFLAIQQDGAGVSKIVIGYLGNGGVISGQIVMPSFRTNTHLYGASDHVGGGAFRGRILGKYDTPSSYSFALFGATSVGNASIAGIPNHVMALASNGTAHAPTRASDSLRLTGVSVSRFIPTGSSDAQGTLGTLNITLGANSTTPNLLRIKPLNGHGDTLTSSTAPSNVAYVSDQIFGFVSNDIWLVTAPNTGASSDYVAWGYWGASARTPGTVGHAGSDGRNIVLAEDINYWVAGKDKERAARHIATLYHDNSTHRYAYQSNNILGHVRTGSSVNAITSGSVRLAFDFGAGRGSLVAGDSYLRFNTASGNPWDVSFGNSVVDRSGDFSSSLDGGAGNLRGEFYGENANAIGGSFNVSRGGEHAAGVFHAPRVNP